MKFYGEISGKWKERNSKGREYWRIALKLPDGSRQEMKHSRYIAECTLGKVLPPKAVVHHKDGDILDDGPGNLVVCEDTKYHEFLHVRTRALKATGNADSRKCGLCKEWGLPGQDDMVTHRRKAYLGGVGQSVHRSCARKRTKTRGERRSEWRAYNLNLGYVKV